MLHWCGMHIAVFLGGFFATKNTINVNDPDSKVNALLRNTSQDRILEQIAYDEVSVTKGIAM